MYIIMMKIITGATNSNHCNLSMLYKMIEIKIKKARKNPTTNLLLRTLKNSLLGEFFNFYASTKLPH